MELGNGLSCGFKLCKHRRQLRIQPRNLFRQRVRLALERVLLIAQALILAVARKDSLLALDQFRC